MFARALLGVGLVVLLFALSSCAFSPDQSTMSPAGEIAKKQIGLLAYTAWLSIIVVLGVGGAMYYILTRFRAKSMDDPLPEQSHGNTAIEVGLILVATLITILVAVRAVPVHLEVSPRITEPTAEDLVVNVTGYQWWWKFEYPSLGITTANELHVPADTRVILNLNSADVLHSFWVPRLAGKTDLIPGQNNQLWFVTDGTEPGIYRGQCAELCLGAHAYMRFRVVVDDAASFDNWVADFQNAATLQASSASLPGANLFKQKCASCHAISGVSATITGPNLTNFGLRNTVAAGVLDNTAENLAAWLRDPQQVKPTNYMPTLGLTETEIDQLVEYLHSLGREELQASLGGTYGDR
jgi:cytochrome c oxidase subunit 2